MNFLKNKSNRRVTIICVLIALTSFYFMHDDSVFKNGDLESASSIGSFEKLNKDVRRKNISNYFWSELKSQDSLALGDSIFTGPESSVTIKLSSGQLMTIAPNSLIKFKMKNKQMLLDIPYGSVQMDNVVDSIAISDCGQQYSIAKVNEPVNLKKTERCGSIAVSSKSVKIKSAFKQNSLASTVTEALDNVVDSVDSLASRELAAVPQLAASYDSPGLDQLKTTFKITNEKSQILKWNPVAESQGYNIEISNDREFKTFEKFTTSTSSFQIAKPSESFFYRLQSIGPNKQPSAYSEIGQVFFKFPSIKLANNKITKNYSARNSKDNAKVSVQLSWSKVPHASKYVIDPVGPIAGTKLNSTKSRSPASTIEVPSPGVYSYKVSAYDASNRKISSSDVGQIVYNKVFSLLAPVIKEGVNDKYYFTQQSLAKYLWLTWEAQGPERMFRVEIARDNNFTNVFRSLFASKDKILLTEDIPAGDYFWRVRTESQEKDQYSDWSNTENFKIKIGKN